MRINYKITRQFDILLFVSFNIMPFWHNILSIFILNNYCTIHLEKLILQSNYAFLAQLVRAVDC